MIPNQSSQMQALQHMIDEGRITSNDHYGILAKMLTLLGKYELKTLLIDMDEVVAELLACCCEKHNKQFSTEFAVEEIDDWGFGVKHFAKMWESPGFFRQLPVVPNAKEVLEDLSQSGFEIYFVTSPWHMVSIMEKMAWVEEHFPFIGWRRVIAFDQKQMIDGDLLFDDGPANLQVFNKGLRIALHRGYNKNIPVHARMYGPDAWLYFRRLVLEVRTKLENVLIGLEERRR